MVNLAPHFLAMAMPIAFLLGALVGLGRLAEDRELLALGAAGVTPAVLFLCLCSSRRCLPERASSWAATIEPRGLARVTDFAGQTLRRNIEGNIHPGVFFDDLTGLTLYAEEVDPVTHEWRHVMVHDRSRSDLSPPRPGSTRPPGDPHRGRCDHLRSRTVRRTALRRRVRRTTRASQFEKGAIEVGLGEGFFRHNTFRSNKDELTAAELSDAAETARQNHAPNALELAVASRRRLATPLAPLAFALVAIPMAANLRRSARTVGFALSGLCFGLYYVVARLGQQWGEVGLVGPTVAAHLPNLVFLALGAALVLSSRVRS